MLRHQTSTGDADTGEANPLPIRLSAPSAATSAGYHATSAITRPSNTTAYTAGDVIGIDAGTAQVETATAAGTITAAVSQVETATAAGTVTAAVSQVETATVVGTVTLSGNASVVVTSAALTGSPLTTSVAVSQGVKQVETATVVGNIGAAGAGNVSVIVTAAGMTGSPKTVSVAVANNDTTSQVATKIRAALVADADVGHVTTGFFVCTGSGADVILTAKAEAANDATMNISVADGTSSGIGSVPTSVDTTAGVAPDNAAAVAGKIRTALGLVSAITSVFTVGGSSDTVTLTKTLPVANDATLNISVANGTCTGLTTAATSANTTAGVATGAGNATVVVTGAGITGSPKTVSVAVADGDTAATWAGKVRTALNAESAITSLYTVGGSTTSITLTRTVPVANDATLNISLDNGTCTGITTAASSTNTTAGVAAGTGNAAVVVTAAGVTGSPLTFAVPVVAGDTAATWAGKVRTALTDSAALSAVYTVGGSTTAITLTKITPAANDATLNISLDNGTCTGITTAATSADTTAGSVTTGNAGSAIQTFTSMGPASGTIVITRADLRIDLSAVPSGMGNFWLYIYDTSPTAVLDNAAFDFPAGDRGALLTKIFLGTPVDEGSTLYIEAKDLWEEVKLAADSTTLYGVLKTEGAYTPASGTVYTTRLRAAAI